jgi:hypothetical protein
MPPFIAGIVVNLFESKRAPFYIVSFVLAAGLLGIFLSKAPPRPLTFVDVLPSGFDLSRPLDSVPWEHARGPTINDKLFELGAHVQNGKIVDQNDKEIIFAHVESYGWGGMSLSVCKSKDKAPKFLSSKNVETQEILREIEKLKRKYTVIITSHTYK